MSSTSSIVERSFADPSAPQSARGRRPYAAAKRAFDFVAAVGLLAVSAPVIVLAAVLVETTSRGPTFAGRWHVGQYGRLFRMYELRTTFDVAEEAAGPAWAEDERDRPTPIGRLLAATGIAALPRLFNVLTGDMSLVGPRAERPAFIRTFARDVPHYAARLAVRPGLTGLAQIKSRGASSARDVRATLEFDLDYIRRMSWRVDSVIVLRSLTRVGA